MDDMNLDVGDRTIKQEYLDNVLEPFMPYFELEEEIGFKTVEKIKNELDNISDEPLLRFDLSTEFMLANSSDFIHWLILQDKLDWNKAGYDYKPTMWTDGDIYIEAIRIFDNLKKNPFRIKEIIKW